MLTKAFWKGAGERALRTFVQTLVASLIAAVGVATSAWDVDWAQALYGALGIALMSTFLSFATSLGSPDFVAGVKEPEYVVVENYHVEGPGTADEDEVSDGV